MQNYKEIIKKYIKEEKPNTLEDLKDIEILCGIEKHLRGESDIILLTEYLLKTNLFRSFKQLKIEEQIFLNLLTTFCLESNLLIFKETNSTIYNTGDQASFFYIILKGKVSVHKPVEEKTFITQIEYLDHLKFLNFKKENKILFEKTIQANNHLLYINKFEEVENEIRDLLMREETQETKLNFSLFFMNRISEIAAFGNFGEKTLEIKSAKRSETIMIEAKNTILLAVDEHIYREKVSKELNSLRMREAKFLNENFFLQNISRLNFLNKIFDFFKFQEFKKGDVIIFDKEMNLNSNNNYNNNNEETGKEENKNYIYFLREGVLDVTINLNLIELINLIKDLVYKRESFIKDFYHDIDLDMKNQPEKYLEEFKKKKKINLFRLSTYDCIGIEQLYYKKSDLYQATVVSEHAKLYRLSLEDLKQIFKINKNSFGCFNNYVNKKMQNLLKRLISCKDMIIQKIDSSEDYSQEADISKERKNGNNYLNKIQNSLFKINQNMLLKNDANAAGNFNINNSNNYKKNVIRARLSLSAKPPLLENKMLNQNLCNGEVKNNKIYKCNNKNYLDSLDDNKNLSTKGKKNNNRISTNKAKNKDQIKKYKIIENGEDLNILYKNHKSPKEFSKLNDKLFTMLNSRNKYKIPNIEKIIQEEVEKMNKPLSELKREELNLKRMLKCETTNFNNKDKSLNVTMNNKKVNNSNNNVIRKFNTSANLNNNRSRKDLNNSSCFKKMFSSTKNFINKLSKNNNSASDDQYKIDLEKEFFDSLKSNKIKNFYFSSENYKNSSEFNYNEIYGNSVLSPTFSKNSNKNFKNIENILKNEHLNIVVSKIKNLNRINSNKKFDFGFKYDYNNFINTNSFSNFQIGDPKNVLESPMNIFNVSNKNLVNSINFINFSFSSSNNIKKNRLKRVVDKSISNPNIISNLVAKKDSDYLNVKDSSKTIIKNELVNVNSILNANENYIQQKEKIDYRKDNQEKMNVNVNLENNQQNNLVKSNNNNDLDFEIPNIVSYVEHQEVILENKVETVDQDTNTDNYLKKEKENENLIHHKVINHMKIESFLNNNIANKTADIINKNNINNADNEFHKQKNGEIIKSSTNDSSKDFKRIKPIRPVSVINPNKGCNYNSINNTTNQSNLDNATEMNFNSNQNQFLLHMQNATEEKASSNLQTIKNDSNIIDINHKLDSEALKNVNENSNKIDKEINANMDGSNKLVNIKIGRNDNKISIKKDTDKNNTASSFFHYKNSRKDNFENNYTRNNKNNRVNFSNSLLNNKITSTNYNFSSNNVKKNVNSNLNNNNNTTNNNQVKVIDIKSPNYNAKQNIYEDSDYAKFPMLNSFQHRNIPDVKIKDEHNLKRLGLTSVKERYLLLQNIAEKKFYEKFKVINMSNNTSKNELKG
jgi:CRP-like cAMP-binding protein